MGLANIVLSAGKTNKKFWPGPGFAIKYQHLKK